MSRFFDALHSGRVLLMDGAMGTELQRAGIPDGACYEAWNLTHADRVRAVHAAYVAAGAEVLITNTFQANPQNVARHRLDAPLEKVQEAAIGLARAAAGRARFVVADVGPFPGSGEGHDLHTLEAAIPGLKNVDALLLETWSDPLVFSLVRHCQIVSWSEGVPILLSIAYEKNERGEVQSHSGHPPEWFGLLAKQYGVAALGVNCGRDIALEDVVAIVRRYRQVTDLPLFARPNAGTPTRVDNQWRYPVTPEQMAACVPELIAAGAGMIGGCCGTTPEHIAAIGAAM